MSAPFKMTPRDAQMLADALAALTEMTRKTGVRIDAYNPASLRVTGDSVIEAKWDDEARHYIIDDRIGS
jgi:hypothetical protein